ncbi:MAG: EF-hand domain-containing protein [Thermochromatium sp.]
MPAFAKFDLDGNGLLTQAKFDQARAQRIAKRSQQGYPMRGLTNALGFSDIDLNGDGQVDAAEFAAARARHRQGFLQLNK